MSRRRNLETQLHGLLEIRDIMNSMKTLAYMETRKLSRFIDAQHAVVQDIESAARDLLVWHPDILPPGPVPAAVFVLIGTERGFCGAFNQALLGSLEAVLAEHPAARPLLVAIGRKLHTVLEQDTRVAALLDGAGVVEEVTAVIDRTVGELNNLQRRHGGLGVVCLYHDADGEPRSQRLLPPFQDLAPPAPRLAYPPVLNVSPRELLAGLTDHYLLAALQRLLYTSLLVENHQRVTHLDGAVRHLDTRLGELQRRSNALRQEEIIEEIEVILLNTAGGGETPVAG